MATLSKISVWAYPASLFLGITMDGVGVWSMFTDGIAVIGATKLHWPFFLFLGAPFVGAALPGIHKWYIWERRGVQLQRKFWSDLITAEKCLRAAAIPGTPQS